MLPEKLWLHVIVFVPIVRDNDEDDGFGEAVEGGAIGEYKAEQAAVRLRSGGHHLGEGNTRLQQNGWGRTCLMLWNSVQRRSSRSGEGSDPQSC